MKKIMLLMAFALAGTMAFAQQNGPKNDDERGNGDRNRPNRERMHEGMFDQLDLTDDQKKQVEDLQLDHMKATTALRGELDVKKAELELAITTEKPVDKIIAEMGKLETKLLEARIKNRIAIRSLLTDEQKVKFDMAHEGGPGGRMGGPGKMAQHGQKGK